jgi:predicted Zn-dependent protease
VGTRPFDDDGFPATRVSVCEDGVFRNRWATKQYADYLGIKATGNAGNVVVMPGNESLESLRNALRPGLYVEQFALVWPDRMSGDFASEIRIGYEMDSAGRARPIKGGSVSGNIFDGLRDARFSRETVLYGFYGQYQGPKAVLFKGLPVAGQT